MPWESETDVPPILRFSLSLPHPIPFSLTGLWRTNFLLCHVKNAENELLVALGKGT